jgi:8-oxo-dGTP diphosphatase
MLENQFNIRVYGLLINDKQQLLISDERRFSTSFTKFPGGGLEWGEGTKETLIREFKEELNIDVEVLDLFYVNDFFQASAFAKKSQIFSFYYFVKHQNNDFQLKPYNLPLLEDGEYFRWVNFHEIQPDVFTFPIDKKVSELLLETFKNEYVIQ